jgi:glycosyltransferase involved in cell wall biosynthesis
MPERKVYVVAPGGARARGGIGRMVANLAEEWQSRPRPFQLRVVDCYGPDRALLMPFWFVRALGVFTAAVLLRRVALLHVHMAANGSVLRKGVFVYLARLAGLPVLLHLHGGDLEIFWRKIGPSLRRAVARMVQRADRIIVLGPPWWRFAVAELGVDPGRIEIVPNGMADPGAIARERRAGPARLLFLGDVIEQKGVPELLEALGRPELRALDWRLTIAGKGDAQKFIAAARRLALGGRIEFRGWIPPDEARRSLTEADILVLPSHFEGLPMVVIEAMAHGKAVIATAVGAIPDAVGDGESGLLVPVGDVTGLAGALRRLIADEALRYRLGREGRARFLRRYQIGAVADRLEVLYVQLAVRRKGARTHAMQPASDGP